MSDTDPEYAPLRPRLNTSDETRPPFNPALYFVVGAFAGVFPVIYIAMINVERITRSPTLRSRTIALASLSAVAVLGIVLAGPAEWLLPNRDLRLTQRVIAVIASLGFFQLHRGAAAARLIGTNGYATIWKKLLPIIGYSIVQGIASFILLRFVRGLG